jgi:hypothetical protein
MSREQLRKADGRMAYARTDGLLERLASGPVICAEGYLFELERRGYLQAGAFVPEVVLSTQSSWRSYTRSSCTPARTWWRHVPITPIARSCA